ncbi:hypothetical protein KGF57_002581 [Candida theae]|uniref:PHD-type domain-containing protein n=1 Tax=Candida theae TaxID=1198502 RepID=A0AAD5BEM0_9ASCO|nr:uncharacterized protein KGF57_002581 [Candida theae]KAI5958226.1 hypothetical protein KGF57_002581 [Candida theae]
MCRNRFHQVHISLKDKPDAITRTIRIQDKLLPNPAINQIPSRYIVNLNDSTNEVEDANSYTQEAGFCCLCSITRRTSPLIPCQECSSGFHVNCLGISDAGSDDYFHWYCPMCDCYQETALPMRPIRRSLFSGMTGRQSSSTRRLVIRNENDEIDDDFLYNEDPMPVFGDLQPRHDEVARASDVINGGVILRREQKLRSRLSKEEVSSWDMFEQARNQRGGDDDVTMDVHSSSTMPDVAKRRRRRKRPDRSLAPSTLTQEQHAAPLAESSSMQESRISNLIGQLKQAKRQHNTSALAPTSVVAMAPLAQSPSSILPSLSASDSAASTGNSPMESAAYSSDDNEHIFRRELTLDEKLVIQKIVRGKLKPKYKPGSNDKDSISNEEEFIAINKRVSRKIYAHIINSVGEIDDYFKNEVKLRRVINEYIQ